MTYSFGDYELDVERRELRCSGVLVALQPQVFDLLTYLIRSRGRVVTNDDLIESIWGGRIVSASTLTSRLNAARKAIGDSGAAQSVIRTIARKGLRFVAEVQEQERLPNGASGGAPVPTEPATPLPSKPSIAVLPFGNLSSDPEQEYFSDGMAEEVITALARYPSLLVIARNSSFGYKHRAIDIRRIGQELGVRYVLEGSVRKAGRHIRVTAQLIETEAATHIWADRYEGDVTDVFKVQDEITRAVTSAIAPAIADAERQRAMRRPPDSHNAWNVYQRGLWHLTKATPEDNKVAQRCFDESMALDASFSGSRTALALAQMQESGLFATLAVAEARASITKLARQAVAIDEGDAEAHACLSWALNFEGDYEGALSEAQRALTISPNLASAHRALGTTLTFSGEPRQGLAALEASIRLDPRDPLLQWHLNRMAIAHYFSRDYDAAVEVARRVIRLYPDFPLIYRWLAAALGQSGRTPEARDALSKAIAIGGASFDMYVRKKVPWHRAEDYEHMLEGLRKAGWTG